MLKRPKTYDEQVEHLIKEHRLIVNDKNKAINILSKVNYYRLSGCGTNRNTIAYIFG